MSSRKGSSLFFMLVFLRGAYADCLTNAFAIKDSIITLSDDLLDATAAEQRCSMQGGSLASLSDPQVYQRLANEVHEKYTEGLQRIWIFYNPDIPSATRYSVNPFQTPKWKSMASINQLDYVDLYTWPQREMLEIKFCRHNTPELWFVETEVPFCISGTDDFTMYGAPRASSRAVEIFNYGNLTSKPPTSRLSGFDVKFGPFDKRLNSVYAADINVYVGSRFYQTVWNGSKLEVELGLFSLSTSCQQKALHYGDGWMLIDKPCSGVKAYHACQAKFQVSAKMLSCNVIQVTWKKNLNLFVEHFKNISMMVTVGVVGQNQTKTVLYNNQLTIIEHLVPQASYLIKAKVFFQGCSTFTISNEVELKPKYEIPDASAHVSNSINCQIEVSVAKQNSNLSSAYQITAFRTNDQIERVINVNLSSVDRNTVFVSGVDEVLYFTIRQETCSGLSDSRPVKGTCLPQHVSLYQLKLWMLVAIAAGPAITFVLLGMIVCSICRRCCGATKKPIRMASLSGGEKQCHENCQAASGENVKVSNSEESLFQDSIENGDGYENPKERTLSYHVYHTAV